MLEGQCQWDPGGRSSHSMAFVTLPYPQRCHQELQMGLQDHWARFHSGHNGMAHVSSPCGGSGATSDFFGPIH